MKKLFSIALVLVMLLACASALAEEPITLTYAEVNPVEGTVVGDVALAFKDKLEELSGGAIVVDIQASGVMGDEKTVLSNIFAGDTSLDIVRISAFALNQYGAQKSVFLTLPYVFTSEEHYWNFVESDLAKSMLAEAKEQGMPLTGLAYGEEGFRHFFFKNEVKGLEDLKGLKIRVSSDPIMTGMVSNLGASATTVAFTELYSALNTGVVDGAEQPTANYRSNAFHEVAPYLLLDGHTLGALQIVISDAGWAKLNEEQQGWVMEAAQYASSVCREKVAEIEAQTFELLRADGVTIVDVEDKAPWVEACQPTIKANTEKLADLYQQLLDMQ